MDGGEGWRVITCAAADAHDKTTINPIMLRFRPIAPRPAADGSSTSGWRPDNRNGVVATVRTKRKYVRVKKNNEYYKRRIKRKSSAPTSSDLEKSSQNDKRFDAGDDEGLTLQLLPEKTDLTGDSSPAARSCSSTVDRTIRNDQVSGYPDRTAALAERRVIETLVMVESVADTCMDVKVGELGSTDVERINNLERDTCPGFISDGSSRVQWVNKEYKKMVTVGPRNNDGKPSLAEVRVRLVIKDKLLPFLRCDAFMCWVRLQYTWQKEKMSQMVPCDVWKMDSGGFAWKLDVKAALSLGL